MASGDSHQQWAFSQFQQQGQDAGQPGNFGEQGFSDGSTDAFTIAQQWQAHDNQFSIEAEFSAYPPQASEYPTQQPVQHFPAVNAHAQSHQHPQTYSAPLAMDGGQNMSWEYDFGFDTNHLRPGLGPENPPYSGALQQGRKANALTSTSSFAQTHNLTNEAPSQQHFRADPPSNHTYNPSQTPVYGGNTQQSPPQGMAQPLQQRQIVDYRQQPVQQQQSASSQHQPHVPSQHQQPTASQHQQVGLSRHQQAMPQHQHSGVSQHQHSPSQQHQSAIPPQHQTGTLLQNNNQHAPQLQTINHPQQAPRIGTPLSHSVTPAAQPRQSPFNGRNVPPLSMQQQAQHPNQQGRSSPAVSYSAPQQANVPMTVPKPLPSLSIAQTTQSRFVAHQMAPVQQLSQSPAPPTSMSGIPKAMPNPQLQQLQPSFPAGTQANVQQNFQQQFSAREGPLAAPQEPGVGGLAPPRLLSRNDQGIPHFGSRHVGFAYVPSLQVDDDDVEATRTIEELPDPTQISGQQLGFFFPSQNAQPRVVTSDLLREWTQAVDQNDYDGQTALEQRLQRQLGASIPKFYDNRLKQAISLKKKATGKRGPERSKTRPTGDADAAEWDALGIVYLSNPQPTSQEIAEGVAAFGKLIRGHAADLQKAKSRLKSAKEADGAPLREAIDHKLDCIYRAVAAANTWGDPQILANLGGNQKLISDFVSCLIQANNSADHNGKVPRAVLQLLSMATNIDPVFFMESLQFAKIGKKFDSKGDNEIKEFVLKIKQNAAARKAETAKEESKTERTSTPEPSSSGYKGTAGLRDAAKRATTGSTASRASSTTSASSSTVKRPREEEADTKSVKRVAAESTTSLPGQKAVPSKMLPGLSGASTAPVKLVGSGILGTKKSIVKPLNKLPAKADGVKVEIKKEPLKLSSASRIKKAEPPKSEAPSASKLGGISALLDSISNAKSRPTGRATPEKEAKPEKEETPEEKTRRLRKEKRRHLRVSWKEGEDLTEVRLFHKDAEEDEGRASNMIRDAHDDRSEGMMLKQGLMSQTQDDEEEDDELPYRPWFQPTGVDFTTISTQTRSKSFVTRAGQVEFETQQQKFIAERDNKELMVVYTDPSDIPPTPKSPYTHPSEDSDMTTSVVHELAQDDDKLAEIHLRWGEANSRGFSWARLNALRRAQKGQSATLSDVANLRASTASAASNAAPIAKSLSSEDQILALLTSDHAKGYRDPDPFDPANPKTQHRHDYVEPEVQHAADMVETVAEQLKSKPFPPMEPPEWISNDKTKVAEWWHGYNRDKQRAEYKAQQQMMIEAAQAQPAAQPQVTPQAVQTAADPNAAAWAAYYAQLQQQQQQQVQPQTGAQDANAAAWAAYYAQQQLAAAPAQPAGDSTAQLNAVLAALSATPAPPQQQAAARNSTDPQLQALLASLGATPAGQQPAHVYQPQATQSQAPDPSDPNYLSYIMSLATGQPSDQGPAYNTDNDYPRDDSREREMDGIHPSRRDEVANRKARGGGKGGRDQRAGGGSSVGGGSDPAHLRGINLHKIGTKPCTFWAKGTCQKGEQCTFRHD